MITFNTDGMVAQSFPFPAPIMDYIFKNLQPQHLIKLYQCCKFFYAKYRLNIIRNLTLVDEVEDFYYDDDEASIDEIFAQPETFDPTSTVIYASNPALKKLKDFWISDSFFYSLFERERMPDRVTIPYFSHCTIRKLEMRWFLTWEEYVALTKAGTVEELKVENIYENEDDDDLVSIDKIIAQVPNATSIEIEFCRYDSTSFTSLAALNHHVKISKFFLTDIDDFDNNFNLDLLFEFLNKNADLDCKVHLDFDEELELEQMGVEYTNIIAARLQAKKKEMALDESNVMP